MARTAKKVVETKEVVDEFVITIKIDSRTYEGRGSTALEALRAIPAPSNDLISSGSVSISHGDKRKDDIFFPTIQLRRLLNPYNMEVLINDLALGL